MTSRALRLLATKKWIRPLNATLALPSTSGLVRLEPYSLLPARTLVTSTWLHNSLLDEDEVILLVGTTKNESRMRYKQTQFRTKICQDAIFRYKELLEKAGDRNLVRVKTTKIAESVPKFRIMSDVDLEVGFMIRSKLLSFRLQRENKDQLQGHSAVERFLVNFILF